MFELLVWLWSPWSIAEFPSWEYSNILCDWKVENVQWQIKRQLITLSFNKQRHKHTQMSQETGCQREGSLSRPIGSEDSSGWSAALSLKPACTPYLPSSLYFPVYQPARLLVWMFSFSPPSRYLPVAHGHSPDLIAPVWLPDVIKRLRISTPGSLMESGVRCIVWKMPWILPLSYFRVSSCFIHLPFILTLCN